jgi:hypothetical protein
MLDPNEVVSAYRTLILADEVSPEAASAIGEVLDILNRAALRGLEADPQNAALTKVTRIHAGMTGNPNEAYAAFRLIKDWRESHEP